MRRTSSLSIHDLIRSHEFGRLIEGSDRSVVSKLGFGKSSDESEFPEGRNQDLNYMLQRNLTRFVSHVAMRDGEVLVRFRPHWREVLGWLEDGLLDCFGMIWSSVRP